MRNIWSTRKAGNESHRRGKRCWCVGGGGALGDELRWENSWKVAGLRVGQKAQAFEVQPVEQPRAGMAAGYSGLVKPGEPVPQNPLGAGFEASEPAGRGAAA